MTQADVASLPLLDWPISTVKPNQPTHGKICGCHKCKNTRVDFLQVCRDKKLRETGPYDTMMFMMELGL